LGAIIESILMPVSTTDGQAYNYSQVIKQNSSVKKLKNFVFYMIKKPVILLTAIMMARLMEKMR